MSTYQELKGLKVKYLSADTSGDRAKEGEVFYNSASFKLASHIAVGAWSSSSPLNTARYGNSGSGTQTAALSSGGNVGPSDTRTTAVEEYNGTGFSAGGALPTATRSAAAAGTQTATIFAGGYDTANTAECYTYDGSSWTGIPALNTARRSLDQHAAGTSTAALVAGGYVEPSQSNTSEEYNGSSWSEGNNLNTARSQSAAGGIQTASFLAGGTTGSVSNATEEYNGTSWSNATNLNTARSALSGGGAQTAGIVFGGSTNRTEQYDGTTWTETADMATARGNAAPANQPGANTATVAMGGGTPIKSDTEEFNITAATITAAAWSSGGTLNTKHTGAGASGTQTAALVSGGNDGDSNPPHVYSTPDVEEYNGTSWAEQNNLSTARFNLSGSGSQTAGLVAGGNLYPGISNATEEYDGTNWANGGNLGTGRTAATMFGIQTASVFCGGYGPGSPPPATTLSEEYNGSSWTAGNALNTARKEVPGSFGIESAGVAFAGTGPGTSNVTEEYDGTNWTTVNTMILTHTGCWAAGTLTDGIGGGGGPTNTSAEGYDGTTWSTRASLGTGRATANGLGSPSSASAALVSAGEPNRTATEEFTGETTALNLKTITDS